MFSFQGLCADQSKVSGYHRFQQADFSQTVLAELSKLFEARSELLHQKVALHAYTALLSRLQVESYLYHLLKGERCVFSALQQKTFLLMIVFEQPLSYGTSSCLTLLFHCWSLTLKLLLFLLFGLALSKRNVIKVLF